MKPEQANTPLGQCVPANQFEKNGKGLCFTNFCCLCEVFLSLEYPYCNRSDTADFLLLDIIKLDIMLYIKLYIVYCYVYSKNFKKRAISVSVT